MRRLSAHLCIAVLWLNIASAVAQAQADSRYFADVRAKIERELTNLLAQNYSTLLSLKTVRVDKGNSASHQLQLTAGTTYALVAACNQGCEHVALSLYDPTGALLMTSPEVHDTVIVAGAPHQSGMHTVKLTVPQCPIGPCYVGLAVAHQAAPVAVPQPQLVERPRTLSAESLPAGVPIDPQILSLIQSHPFFSGAPPVRVRGYEIAGASSFVANGTPTRSSFAERHEIQALGNTVFIDQEKQEGATRHRSCAVGQCMHYSQGVSVRAGNGLLVLGDRSASRHQINNFRSRPTDTSLKLIRFEHLDGKLFPIAVGNRYSYRTVHQQNSSDDGAEESTTLYSCEISRQFNANRFHINLTGNAFLTICNVQTNFRRDASSNNSTTDREVYFDELGTWMRVDAVFPRETVVQDGDPSRTSFHTLMSFEKFP